MTWELAANVSMLFGEHAFLDRFEAARKAGFAFVEAQFPYVVEASEVARAVRDAGVTLVLFNVPAGDLLDGGDGLACVPGAVDDFAEALDRAAEYARVLAPTRMNLLAGRMPAGGSEAACASAFDASLRATIARLSPLGVEVVVEALNGHDFPRFFLQTHDDVLRAIEGTSARVQYDVYHQARMGRDVVADLEADLVSIAHVQFADTPGRNEPGTGTLPFGRIVGALRDARYHGYLAAEYRPRGATLDSLAWMTSDDFRA